MAPRAASLFLVRLNAAELPADVAAEVAKFKDPDPKVRQKALTALGKMGEKAKPAIPQILEMLKDKITWVTTRALMVLVDIGPDETCVKPVATYLGMAPEIRSPAVDVLVLLKEKSVPELIVALKDDKSAEGAREALSKESANQPAPQPRSWRTRPGQANPNRCAKPRPRRSRPLTNNGQPFSIHSPE